MPSDILIIVLLSTRLFAVVCKFKIVSADFLMLLAYPSVCLSVIKYHIYNVLHYTRGTSETHVHLRRYGSCKRKSTTLMDKLLLEEGGGFGRGALFLKHYF